LLAPPEANNKQGGFIQRKKKLYRVGWRGRVVLEE
jgi:hypothetical protein